ncbi:MAG: hypothetical protein ACRYGP_29205 [Janthinobacterium lividum]
MRILQDPVASPLKAAARDLTLARNRIGLAATAVMLAATVMIAMVAPI